MTLKNILIADTILAEPCPYPGCNVCGEKYILGDVAVMLTQPLHVSKVSRSREKGKTKQSNT